MQSFKSTDSSNNDAAVKETLVFPPIQFDNKHIKHLPIDPIDTVSVREVSNAIFSKCLPTPVRNPQVVAYSASALALLEDSVPIISPGSTSASSTTENILAMYLSGNKLIDGSFPLAHCYAGYQFGSFAGQLGDGAAILLGEVVNNKGERWELQLKGAGQTPFSRSADGRKVLRSSIREFLCSEAMHFLGVPTTRAGSVITSDTVVARDPQYDGSVINERCTIISRIASNFFRFGSLEVFLNSAQTKGREGPSARNHKLKKDFVDYIIQSYYPQHNRVADGVYVNESEEVKYSLFLNDIAAKTAELVAHWQTIGFVHGVLNTDNMSLMGLTIDYGPFAFMEQFDPDFTPNGSDGSARYSYSRQPEACRFNIKKLSESLDGLVCNSDVDIALALFDTTYLNAYNKRMNDKLGLLELFPDDIQLVKELFIVMQATSSDFTDTFVALTEYLEDLSITSSSTATESSLSGTTESRALASVVGKLLSRCATPTECKDAIVRSLRISRLSLGLMPQQIDMVWNLLQSNDASVQLQVADMFGGMPIEIVMEEVSGEKRKLEKIRQGTIDVRQLEVMTIEEKKIIDEKLWREWLSKYDKRLLLQNEMQLKDAVKIMKRVNPTFVLRNWIAQQTIVTADQDDFRKVRQVLKMLETPFDESYSPFKSSDCSEKPDSASKEFISRTPPWANSLVCTCSS